MNHYETNLDKNKANYVPLTPLTFLKRAREIYPNYEAIIYEDRKYTWEEVYKRAVNLLAHFQKLELKKEIQFRFWPSIHLRFSKDITQYLWQVQY